MKTEEIVKLLSKELAVYRSLSNYVYRLSAIFVALV